MLIQTIAPVHCMVAKGLSRRSFDLGAGVRLVPLPRWLKRKKAVADLHKTARGSVLKEAKHALVVEYEVSGPNDTIRFRGPKKRPKPSVAVDRLLFTQVALWIQKPTILNVYTAVHVQITERGARPVFPPHLLRPVGIHENETGNALTVEDLGQVAQMNAAIDRIRTGGSLWAGLRALLRALVETEWQFRYLAEWIVLEALFGPDEPGETTFQLAQRTAYFVATDAKERLALFSKLKELYRIRSKIVHGKFLDLEPEPSLAFMNDTEVIIRKALQRILTNDELLNQFLRSRDVYLRNMTLGVFRP